MTTERPERPFDVVREMLGPIAPDRYRIDGGLESFAVTLAGNTIVFDARADAIDRPLEQLAAAIESGIAFDRAHAMLKAGRTPAQPLPLWLVTGSSVLAAWLSWSRTEAAFRRRLRFSDQLGVAPVTGIFARPARQLLGQTVAKIRVRSGLAVAERIDLPGKSKCTATVGQTAQIRIEGNPLPETVIVALSAEPGQNHRRDMADIVDHPFFASAGLKLAHIRNDGDAVVIDIESHWGPLAPVPQAAWAAIPQDADVTCPWRATGREIAELYRLVDAGRGHSGLA